MAISVEKMKAKVGLQIETSLHLYEKSSEIQIGFLDAVDSCGVLCMETLAGFEVFSCRCCLDYCSSALVSQLFSFQH